LVRASAARRQVAFWSAIGTGRGSPALDRDAAASGAGLKRRLEAAVLQANDVAVVVVVEPLIAGLA
jgi:hypothetical protein